MTIRAILLCLAFTAGLSGCYLTPPGVPLTDAPAEPLVRSLEQRRASFAGLRAVARVETERKGKKRAYESVAVILQGMKRFRIEGYGPMGDRQFTLLWDGTDVLLTRAGDETVHKAGQFGFERMLGVSLSPSDLCAILSGNIPSMPPGAETTAGCSKAGWCLVDFRQGDLDWRVQVRPAPGAQDRVTVEQMELLRHGTEILRAWYVYKGQEGPSDFPSAVGLAQKDGSSALFVHYQEAEANVPVDDSAFVLDGQEAGR